MSPVGVPGGSGPQGGGITQGEGSQKWKRSDGRRTSDIAESRAGIQRRRHSIKTFIRCASPKSEAEAEATFHLVSGPGKRLGPYAPSAVKAVRGGPQLEANCFAYHPNRETVICMPPSPNFACCFIIAPFLTLYVL
jgi:hypothetical protein